MDVGVGHGSDVLATHGIDLSGVRSSEQRPACISVDIHDSFVETTEDVHRTVCLHPGCPGPVNMGRQW